MGQTTFPQRQRRPLHFDSLIQRVRQRLESLPEQRRCPSFPLADTAMAGLALFSLKDPSLLAFCGRALDHNLRSVFGLQSIPSDTPIREILDEVNPDQLRPLFKDIFRPLQRGKVLEEYVFLDGCYLVALDGVEYFCSQKVHCDPCMTRTHKDGTVSYYHPMLGAVLPAKATRTSRRSSPWPPSRSRGRTAMPRTTANAMPPAAGSGGSARTTRTCRSSLPKTP